MPIPFDAYGLAPTFRTSGMRSPASRSTGAMIRPASLHEYRSANCACLGMTRRHRCRLTRDRRQESLPRVHAARIVLALAVRLPSYSVLRCSEIRGPIWTMKLLCLFGHRASHGHWNDGLVFGTCQRCGRFLIRLASTNWYALPRGYYVKWNTIGAHAASPRRVVSEARRQSPAFHRLRRRKRAMDRYYL